MNNQPQPWTMKEADELVRSLSAFKSFYDLVHAKNYIPTLQCRQTDKARLADIYDSYMIQKKRSERAYRQYGSVEAHKAINADYVEAEGYKKFNGGDHLPVDIPTQGATLTCNLPDGKQITFCFIPKEKTREIECCDILLSGRAGEAKKQKILGFAKGKTYKFAEKEDIQLTTILIADSHQE